MGCLGSKLTVDIYDPVLGKIEKNVVSSLVSQKCKNQQESWKELVILQVDQDGEGTICTKSTSGSDSAASGCRQPTKTSRKKSRNDHDDTSEKRKLIEEIEKKESRNQEYDPQGMEWMVFEEIELVLESCSDKFSGIDSESCGSSSDVDSENNDNQKDKRKFGMAFPNEEQIWSGRDANAEGDRKERRIFEVTVPNEEQSRSRIDVKDRGNLKEKRKIIVYVPDERRIQMRQDKAFREHIARVNSSKRKLSSKPILYTSAR